MFLQEELARARHQTELRHGEQLVRVRRLIAARRARQRAERTACVARQAALQAALAHASLE
jgi:hypothetical protein